VQIGPHRISIPLVVAPMAGVTDRPFRQLCKRLGAGLAVSEMVASNPKLWNTAKSLRRTDHRGEVEPIVVQIAGADPAMMADAAWYNVERGAQIIDINMGCPAKKVCNVAAGSALLQDEPLVAAIVAAVVAAVPVPVTLKIRTGWNRQNRNAVRIARIAEDAGVAALSVHGRTRECGYVGPVEYETIRSIKRVANIPVIANGDIDSPEKAREVLDRTGADAIMIGRAAQGRPWIFREIGHFLSCGERLPPPRVDEIHRLIVEHLVDHYAFYGEVDGVRIARKHLGWYTSKLVGGDTFRAQINRLESSADQVAAVDRYFGRLAAAGERLVYAAQAQIEASWVEEALAA
jgi:tRNA-dihydrouridine synthase B